MKKNRSIKLTQAKDHMCEVCSGPKTTSERRASPRCLGVDVTFSKGPDDWDEFGFFLCQIHARLLADNILEFLDKSQGRRWRESE